MGRLLTLKYYVTGDLLAESPIHIGAAFGDLVADMPLARDGAGRFYLPGTSLAGPIRLWWARHNGDADTTFGQTPPRNEGKSATKDEKKREGHASYIVVDDAPAVGAPVPETRDGVGIDRRTGAAAEAIKYDREVLPRGTRFAFRAEIDVWGGTASVARTDSKFEPPSRPDPVALRDKLGTLVAALERGHIRFGAAKTRGLGRLKLEATRVSELKIGDRAGLLARLKQGPDAAFGETLALERISPPSDEIAIMVRWRAELPVMNKSEAQGVSIDALPLVTGDGDRLQPVITGASVKGVLRSHAERICRTLGGLQPSDPSAACIGSSRNGPKQDFLDDLAECALIEGLFGAPGKGDKDDKLYGGDPNGPVIPGIGALSVDDCLIDKPITRAEWRNLLTEAPRKENGKDVEEKMAAVRRVIDRPDGSWKDFRPAAHNAIDRWTGGVADGLLFSRLEPTVGGTHTFELRLDLNRIARRHTDKITDGPEARANFQRAAFALLIVTLRDLARGRIPIGYGVTRGLGSIAVEGISLTFGGATASDLAIKGIPADGAIEIDPDGFDKRETMQRFVAVELAWQAYWPRGCKS